MSESLFKANGYITNHTTMYIYMFNFCIFRNWDIELERKRSGRKPRLFVAVIKMIWPKLLIHIILAAGKVRLSCKNVV